MLFTLGLFTLGLLTLGLLSLALQLEAGNAERDHEWLVEQLPGGAGYRVYQSYMWAYRQVCVGHF